MADRVLSTLQMLYYVKSSKQRSFVIGTEAKRLYGLCKENLTKLFYLVSKSLICLDIKKRSLKRWL